MRTYLQLTTLIGLMLAGCMRQVCVLDDIEEDSYSSINTSKRFFFDSFDQNQDRLVDREEFRERVAVKFRYLDIDGSGTIELGRECRDNPWCQPALARAKSTLSPGAFLDEALAIFDAADKNGDQRLEQKEFTKLPPDTK